MHDSAELRTALDGLFGEQTLAVLCTHRGGQPYGSLVAFTVSEDLSRIWFATLRTTRKFANLSSDGRVALLIDSRSHRDVDFHQAMAATAVGTCSALDGEAGAAAARQHLTRHPHLRDFVEAPTCAMVEVAVSKYVVVRRFQTVRELRIL